ncbi:histidine phosphatase family protein [Actinomyces slackii]|uniref:Bifunctional RNase H/acid phosphatase n=1 Tax=Actinomyces slackii TaxID=52774 RepID=A0A3S4SQJ0_9ACTO|nr:bifunctional RNase H/acid phosphatase [Actinomyces slackii]
MARAAGRLGSVKLLLVRHGRTIANVMNALDTAFPGNPLDDEGQAQARALPGRLEAAGHLEGISSLWVSPILRARQTIAPLEAATGITARIASGLREVLAGELEMNTDARSMRCYMDTTRSWMVGRTAARIPGSHEDGQSTFERFNAVVEEIAGDQGTQTSAQENPVLGQGAAGRGTTGKDAAAAGGGTALLVAHGTILRLWTALAAAKASGVDPAWIANSPLPNTGIAVVEGGPASGWRLLDWNEGAWRAGS